MLAAITLWRRLCLVLIAVLPQAVFITFYTLSCRVLPACVLHPYAVYPPKAQLPRRKVEALLRKFGQDVKVAGAPGDPPGVF